MIDMLNGAFGIGKTSAVRMLQALIPNSMIFDPKVIGYMLRKIITEEIKLAEERTDDFHDLDLWRILVVNIAKELKVKYNKHLIVPITLYKTDIFEYIIDGLRSIDQGLFHFCLLTSEDIIKTRIKNRGDILGT